MDATERQIDDFHRACRLIVRNAGKPAVNWAVNYAKAGLDMEDAEEIKVQCLYIKGNIAHWRGAEALETRTILQSLIGELEQ